MAEELGFVSATYFTLAGAYIDSSISMWTSGLVRTRIHGAQSCCLRLCLFTLWLGSAFLTDRVSSQSLAQLTIYCRHLMESLHPPYMLYLICTAHLSTLLLLIMAKVCAHRQVRSALIVHFRGDSTGSRAASHRARSYHVGGVSRTSLVFRLCGYQTPCTQT